MAGAFHFIAGAPEADQDAGLRTKLPEISSRLALNQS